MIFKKKQLYVIDYYCYGPHRTIVDATDEIQAIKKLYRRVWQGPGMEYPEIRGIIPFKEVSDSGDRKY